MDPTIATSPYDGTLPYSNARSQFQAGDIIDERYRLEQLLGTGGMGEVWQSRHTTLGRLVALKLVRVAGELRSRLLHEARTLASLRHPAIVTVHDAGITGDGIGYLAMDVLVGENLANRVARARLEVRDGVALFVELLAGLEAAHAAGIIHRDLKPGNVLLVSRDATVSPVLIDFGIAVPATVEGTNADRAGTPAYMAPEQFCGLACTERTDVWASCVSLYETVTGRIPFIGGDLASTAQQVVESPLAYPTDVSGIDGKLWRILTCGLRKDPADRTPNILELRAALAGWLARGSQRTGSLALPTAPLAPAALVPAPRRPGREPSPFELSIRKKFTEG